MLVLSSFLAANSKGVTVVEIVAAVDTANTNITQIKTSGAVNMANANLSDYTALECTAEEIEQLGQAAGVSLRYVAARITTTENNSLSAVTYMLADSKRPAANLTASVAG